jgi:hypothetical protein
VRNVLPDKERVVSSTRVSCPLWEWIDLCPISEYDRTLRTQGCMVHTKFVRLAAAVNTTVCSATFV